MEKMFAVFADIVATPKDALGGPVFAIGGLVLIGLIILAVWGVSFFILKWIKNKNVGQ